MPASHEIDSIPLRRMQAVSQRPVLGREFSIFIINCYIIAMDSIAIRHIIPGLVRGKALIQPGLIHFINGQDTIKIDVANLMHDQSFTFAAVHNQHRVFHTAAFQPVSRGDLGIGI